MEHVVIVGASVRAAAFSALRAGLRPWAIDLFADRDLAAICLVRAVPAGGYPDAIAELTRDAPPGPWMYTGAIENRPDIVEQISRDRPLWGNDATCLARVRDPFAWTAAVRDAGLACPNVWRPSAELQGQWLLKPLASGGGVGVRAISGTSSGPLRDPAHHYLQEFVAGDACAGLFVADRGGCRLLGVTRQLVGEKWLHAAAFRYAGSIGPLPLGPTEGAAWERLGKAMAAFAGLRGLFGIDAIVRNGVPWPVEINPRYTASVEVIEYSAGLRAMELHTRAFVSGAGFMHPAIDRGQNKVIGKAIWFAPRRIRIPADGPWAAQLRQPPSLDRPPAFADIPAAGVRIAAGRPVMTVFASADSAAECEQRLRGAAADLDNRLLR